MSPRRVRLHGAIFALLLLGGASGCGANVSVGTPATNSAAQELGRPTGAEQARVALATGRAQRRGTCQIAPPQVRLPTGEWTATETILSTYAIDACAGERLSRPWDFRRVCGTGSCSTYLYTASFYGVEVAEVVPDGRGRYIATFRAHAVPCPHRPGENAGTNEDRKTITIWSSPGDQTLHGLGRSTQVGACGHGRSETDSYVAARTDPTANPPAEGP